MTKGVSAEARQRNGIAVQRLFHRDANAQRRTNALLTREKAGQKSIQQSWSDHYAGCEAAGPSFRVSATSAAALVGSVGGMGGLERPSWTSPDGRGLLQHPAVDVPSHLCRQLALSAEMGTLTPEERQAALTRTTPVQKPSSELHVESLAGADRSCFVLAVQKAHHAREVTPPDPHKHLTPYEANAEQWKAYHHQQAVLRHEQTLPRRRAMDPYVHLTGAQVDAGLTMPNAYTADRLAALNGGRWVLDNPYHQQLYRGEPVMTKVMRGDYYGDGAAQRAAGRPRHDVAAKNRRDVRVTSEVNRAERRLRQRAANSCMCSQ
jgi:hypothetical protein